MPLNTGTVVPNTRESDSQRLGILFPTLGNPVPNAWESCSQRLGVLFPCRFMYPVCRREEETGKEKVGQGRGFVSHGGEKDTEEKSAPMCRERNTGKREEAGKKRRKGKANGADVIYHFPSMYSTEEPEEVNKTSLLTTRRGGRSSLIVPEPIKVVPLGTGDTRAVAGVIVYISLVRPFGMA